jgi:hypothetical protein
MLVTTEIYSNSALLIPVIPYILAGLNPVSVVVLHIHNHTYNETVIIKISTERLSMLQVISFTVIPLGTYTVLHAYLPCQETSLEII